MNVETVKAQLRKLKLSTAAKEFDEVTARHKAAVSLHWISEVLEREIDKRRERSLEKRIDRAVIPLDRDKIEELSKLDFVRNNRIALFLGKPGTGKTHMALAIGLLALKADLRVYCASAKMLAYEITLARAKNSMDALFKKILSADLWIIDNWGVVSMGREIAEEVFDLFDRRKYNSAMVLTSNRDLKEWNEVFSDPVLANATIDRMFDRAEIVVFEGQSYRLKGSIELPDFRSAIGSRKEIPIP